jgi:hypothetical protein
MRVAGLAAIAAVVFAGSAPPASAWIPLSQAQIEWHCPYAIVWISRHASVDETVQRIRDRGLVVIAVYRGLRAYVVVTTEEGMELDAVWRDPATRVISDC